MTQSPFIEGTQLQWAWDSTSLGWAKTCLRLYYYQQIVGWAPRSISFHLDFGIWYHSALEQYDKLRASGTEAEAAVLQVVKTLFEKTWIDDPEGGHPALTLKNEAGTWENVDNNKTRETLIRSVVWYLDQFGENDPAKTLILPNGQSAVELSFQMETELDLPGKDGHYVLSGHLDRVVSFDGDPYVMDRKTTKSTISPYYFKRYSPDNQMTLYSLAAAVVFHAPVKGVIIDAAQIAVGFTAFQRGIVTRTQAQLTEWLADLEPTLASVARAAESGHWPMNDTSCDKFGGCPFRDICSKDPGVRDQFLSSNYVVRKWNPLDIR